MADIPRENQNDSVTRNASVLMVTSVPFWFCGTGAEQRMFSVLSFLRSRGHRVTVFYMHELTSLDRNLVADKKLDVRPFKSGHAGSVSWQQKFWMKAARFWPNRTNQVPNHTSQTKSSGQPTRALEPDDFRWSQAETQYLKLVDELKPSLIVIEYVALTCYVDYLPAEWRSEICVLLDAHDVMYQRCRRFAARGEQNWLNVDRAQESALISKYDGVLAIQNEEAKVFKGMASNIDVIVAGHCPQHFLGDVGPSHTAKLEEASQRSIIVGFLGSNNQPNLLGARWLLSEVWPRVIERSGHNVRLLLVGGFTDRLAASDLTAYPAAASSIEMRPQLSDLSQFYDAVDIVVNPVDLGSGLKIKNVEALYFGKPLVTTSHSATGLPASLVEQIQIADAPEHFAAALQVLIDDNAFRQQTARLTLSAARAEFSESAVYASFGNWLDARGISPNS